MLEINLKGKNAVVTGGSRGVGAGICKVLAKAGANVIINYAGNEEKAREVLKAVEDENVKGYIFKADVSSKEDVENLFKFAEE